MAAVNANGLVGRLKGDRPLTVFAPTGAAFRALPAGTVEDLLKPENKSKLANVLTYHVVPGWIYSAHVVKAGIEAVNGVVHVTDSVILPKQATSRSRALLARECGGEE